MSKSYNHYKERIESFWESPKDPTALKPILEEVLIALETGDIALVTHQDASWQIHEWVKKAILLVFRLNASKAMGEIWWDKIPLRPRDFAPSIRQVPGSWVRRGVYLGPSSIIMPSFVNIGAHIRGGTMIDSGVTVGSGVFIGEQCHIGANVTLGGVLEPLQTAPVIIEDHVFIGAGSHILEGVHIEKGAVLGAGVILSASTKLIRRDSGAISYGHVPAYSVVVPGSYAPFAGAVSLACAVILKQVDATTRKKTAINDLLRE